MKILDKSLVKGYNNKRRNVPISGRSLSMYYKNSRPIGRLFSFVYGKQQSCEHERTRTYDTDYDSNCDRERTQEYEPETPSRKPPKRSRSDDFDMEL